jgi:membrane protease YdiL (CAAX protease family)
VRAAAWLALVVLAEVVFLLAGLVPGLVASILALACLLLVGLLRPGAADGRAAIALSVIPLMRVLGIALPSTVVPTWTWYAEIGVGVLIATLLAARVLHLGAADLGLRRAPAVEIAIAVGIGFVLGLALAVIAESESVLPDRSPVSLLIVTAVIVVGGALSEELLLRGLVQRVAGEIVETGAVAVSTGLTALLYVGSLSVQYVLVMTAFAYVYGSVTRRTGSLMPAIAGHGVLLWSQLVLWPAVLG